MTIEKVLIVDDEEIMRDFLVDTLKKQKIDAISVENGKEAIKLIRENFFDMVITDMKMPGLTGLEVLKTVKELSPDTIVVIVTAHGSINNAVDAMKLGAFHYLVKPFSVEAIWTILDKAQEYRSLVIENQYLRQQVSSGERGCQKIIAESSDMKKILADVTRIAKSNASVFINGESGTGKEVIAQAIHFHSLRANKPFIKVNCAAIPETLIESEFFGHEKGAFTGANQRKLGRFELANFGTLLLDEISEIPLPMQAKLLRAVQEQEFDRIGGTKSIQVDLRILSTSNRNIEELIQKNLLRKDLFYRLNVVPIMLPPLRNRKEDIIPLAEYFIERFCKENHKELKSLTEKAKKKLLDYPWPGNIRELANIMERAVVMDFAKKITPEHLYLEETLEMISSPPDNILSLHDLEKAHIIETLQRHKNNRTKTAKALGISLKTLRNKLEEYEISLSS